MAWSPQWCARLKPKDWRGRKWQEHKEANRFMQRVLGVGGIVEVHIRGNQTGEILSSDQATPLSRAGLNKNQGKHIGGRYLSVFRHRGNDHALKT